MEYFCALSKFIGHNQWQQLPSETHGLTVFTTPWKHFHICLYTTDKVYFCAWNRSYAMDKSYK